MKTALFGNINFKKEVKTMVEKRNVQNDQLPEEWVELVKEAMKSNITKEEFQRFLKEEKEKRKKD